MGHLLNGTWRFEETLVEQENGKYVKKPSLFGNRVSAAGSSGLHAEPGRYHLYSSTACPWAHRAVIFRVLKKLEGLITRKIVSNESSEIMRMFNTEFAELTAAAPDYYRRVRAAKSRP